MAKKVLGIEIGSCLLKIAQCSDANLERLYTADIPDNLVREDEIVSWEAMADFIKSVLKENKISCKNAAVVLPENMAYIQRITMPAMSADQLKVNLPYEFHDYISEDKDKYFYDYAVISKSTDEEGKVTEMDLMGVAVLKETVNQYRTMFRRAGLRLILIAPEYCAFRNILKDYEEKNQIQEEKDYAILDIGHATTKLHFFTKGEYEITRTMEPGCQAVDQHLAEVMNIDQHIARLYKEANKDNALLEQGCIDIYNQMAIEIMRVLNFYNFNHPDNTVDTIYCCGGGALIKPLLDEVASVVEIPMTDISQLFTDQYEDKEKLIVGLKALGITWE